IGAARALALPLGDGTLIAFAVVFFMAYRPLRDLGDARSAMERGANALAMLESIAETPRVQTRSSPLAAWRAQALVVEGLGVRRAVLGEERVLRTDLPVTSFAARPGETVALVGPTGSGKTTLLRAMLGLEPGAVGSVRYGADDLTGRGVGPSERPFAWV